MQIGAGILTGLVLIFWILNLKNVWQVNKELVANNDSQWVNLKNDLDTTLVDLKKQLNQLDKNKKETAAGDNLIADLIKKTGELASSTSEISTSSPIATTSPTVNQSNKNCPEYIDCMPTIGAARPCQIPVGCEGLTVIAY